MKGTTKLKLLALFVLSILFMIVVLQNAEVTAIKVFVWEFKMSRIVLLSAPAVLGFAVGFVSAKVSSAAKSVRG